MFCLHAISICPHSTITRRMTEKAMWRICLATHRNSRRSAEPSLISLLALKGTQTTITLHYHYENISILSTCVVPAHYNFYCIRYLLYTQLTHFVVCLWSLGVPQWSFGKLWSTAHGVMAIRSIYKNAADISCAQFKYCTKGLVANSQITVHPLRPAKACFPNGTLPDNHQ